MKKIKKSDHESFLTFANALIFLHCKEYKMRGSSRVYGLTSKTEGNFEATVPDFTSEIGTSLHSVYFRFDGDLHKQNFHEVGDLEMVKARLCIHLYGLLGE